MPVPEKIVLASASPRRKELLSLWGQAFEIVPADVDETPWPDEAPPDYVVRMARDKARKVAQGQPDEALIIAADTTVVQSGRILGKPEDAAEARTMLRQLRGRTHQVYSGLALLLGASGELLTDLAVTDVPMRNYSDAEIEAYIQTGDPFDKAGAYAIQHSGFHPVDALAGCYANVVGLPLCHLLRNLRSLNVFPHADIPRLCQAHLNYSCPVYEQILTTRRVIGSN